MFLLKFRAAFSQAKMEKMGKHFAVKTITRQAICFQLAGGDNKVMSKMISAVWMYQKSSLIGS